MRKKHEKPTIRILMVGAAGVGKDSLESRVSGHFFPMLTTYLSIAPPAKV